MKAKTAGNIERLVELTRENGGVLPLSRAAYITGFSIDYVRRIANVACESAQVALVDVDSMTDERTVPSLVLLTKPALATVPDEEDFVPEEAEAPEEGAVPEDDYTEGE